MKTSNTCPMSVPLKSNRLKLKSSLSMALRTKSVHTILFTQAMELWKHTNCCSHLCKSVKAQGWMGDGIPAFKSMALGL